MDHLTAVFTNLGLVVVITAVLKAIIKLKSNLVNVKFKNMITYRLKKDLVRKLTSNY